MDELDNEGWQELGSDRSSRAADLASGSSERGMDKAAMFRLLLGAAVLGVFITFALQNRQSVEVTFLSWDFDIAQFLLIVLSAIVGAVVWQLAVVLDRRRKRKT